MKWQDIEEQADDVYQLEDESEQVEDLGGVNIADEVLEILAKETEVAEGAAIRLEQARLYEGLLKHPLFEGMDADQRAINKVEAEIKAFVMEKLEVLLGMRSERRMQQAMQIELPFSDLEIEALKGIAFKLTNGESAKTTPATVAAVPVRAQAPARRGAVTPRPMTQTSQQAAKPAPRPATPLSSKPQQEPVRQPKAAAQQKQAPQQKQPAAPARKINSIADLTPQELAERNNMTPKVKRGVSQGVAQIPMPAADAMIGAYTAQAMSTSRENSAIANVLGAIPVENVDNDI